MPNHTPNPTKGVLLVMGAVFIFAMSDTVTKHLATIYPISIVLLMRYGSMWSCCWRSFSHRRGLLFGAPNAPLWSLYAR